MTIKFASKKIFLILFTIISLPANASYSDWLKDQKYINEFPLEGNTSNLLKIQNIGEVSFGQVHLGMTIDMEKVDYITVYNSDFTQDCLFTLEKDSNIEISREMRNIASEFYPFRRVNYVSDNKYSLYVDPEGKVVGFYAVRSFMDNSWIKKIINSIVKKYGEPIKKIQSMPVGWEQKRPVNIFYTKSSYIFKKRISYFHIGADYEGKGFFDILHFMILPSYITMDGVKLVLAVRSGSAYTKLHNEALDQCVIFMEDYASKIDTSSSNTLIDL